MDIPVNQLREEKISLERVHEEESESHVNRLARELAALRVKQHQQQQQQALGLHGNGNGGAVNGYHIIGDADDLDGRAASSSSMSTPFVPPREVMEPSAEVLLAALKKENESLRQRLFTTERDFIRVTRLNDIYREELIDHRRRVSI